jgi:hypothetical protein
MGCGFVELVAARKIPYCYVRSYHTAKNLVTMISLHPEEVERLFTVLGIPNRFTAQEKLGLATTDLGGQPADVVSFPTPVQKSGLNLLRLRELRGTNPAKQPSFFDHPWYLEEGFAREDCSPGWHFLQMNVIPGSIGQSANYLSSFERGLELPSAVEVALMLFLHYAGTGVQLLQKKHTWCRDRASMNRIVTVGAFGRNGLFVSAHPAEFVSRGLGICAKLTR